MKFTEAQLESAIIELREAEGYPHMLGKVLGAASSSPTPLGGNVPFLRNRLTGNS